MARKGAEAAAEFSCLTRRQTLPGKDQKKMLQQRLAQRRNLVIAERLGQVEAANFRSECGTGWFDRKRHDHSAITSAASR